MIILRVIGTDYTSMTTTIRTDRGQEIAERVAKVELYADSVFMSLILHVENEIYDYVFKKFLDKRCVLPEKDE